MATLIPESCLKQRFSPCQIQESGFRKIGPNFFITPLCLQDERPKKIAAPPVVSTVNSASLVCGHHEDRGSACGWFGIIAEQGREGEAKLAAVPNFF